MKSFLYQMNKGKEDFCLFIVINLNERRMHTKSKIKNMQNRLGAEAYDLYKKGCEPEFNEAFFRNADEAREKATIKDDWSEPIVEWISKLKDGIRFNENDIYKAVFHKELETYSEAYKRIQRILSDLKYKKIINIMANSIIRKLSKNHIYFILF